MYYYIFPSNVITEGVLSLMTDDLKLTGAIKKTGMTRRIKVKLLKLTLRGQCTEALSSRSSCSSFRS